MVKGEEPSHHTFHTTWYGWGKKYYFIWGLRHFIPLTSLSISWVFGSYAKPLYASLTQSSHQQVLLFFSFFLVYIRLRCYLGLREKINQKVACYKTSSTKNSSKISIMSLILLIYLEAIFSHALILQMHSLQPWNSSRSKAEESNANI